VAFIPIYDGTPRIHTSRPWVSYLIIVICTWVFFRQVSGDHLHFLEMVVSYGVVPAVITGDLGPFPGAPIPPWLTLATSMFLHGDWWHLVGNMLFLFVFGDNVEDSMGHRRFVVFYFLCGVGAAIAHVLFDPSSGNPVIGASGAISGVLGAYLLLHPRARVIVLVGILPLALPAALLLIVWIGLQVFAALAQQTGAAQPIAWWAHIGGFVLGMALITLFKYPTVPLGGVGEFRHGIRLRERGGEPEPDEAPFWDEEAEKDDDTGPGQDGPGRSGPWG
jgi:membrane associated rhomboid family serine protease